MSDLSLEDVLIYEGLDYKNTSGSSGEQLNLRECPACGRSEWKVYANADTSLGNCFHGSCGVRFNLFGFVRHLLISRGGDGKNRDVGEYLRTARTALGYRPKRETRVKVAVDTSKVELPSSMELPDERGNNHPYLESRGITSEYAKLYHLRYSLFGSRKYHDSKGELKEQSFRERIIIPVFDLDGDLVTFQGRDVTGTSDTRYKFAGGLPGTARFLYNGHTAKALRAEHVTLGEGPFDVIKTQIALDQAEDLKKVVALGSFGMELSSTKVGADQLGAFQALKRAGLKRVTIMWDGEPAAWERAVDACLMLVSIGIEAYIAQLPADQDPGEADALVIQNAVRNAVRVTRLSALKLKMHNPYKP